MKTKKKLLQVLSILALICTFLTGCASNGNAEAIRAEHLLPLSDRIIRITSQKAEATFMLYDTKASLELYDQLPLTLETENFRDAQWMFYPPQKLIVTDAEAYHDGKKGELSYYAPWGDVFVLYEDFYAGDEMHQLGICLTGSDTLDQLSGTLQIKKLDNEEISDQMWIQVEINGTTLIALLEENSSAKALYDRLAEGNLTIQMSDYAHFEKVGSLGFRLPTNDEQITTKAGDIILYQGDQLVFYYDTNHWRFTKLGEFQNVDQAALKELFGTDGITAILSR